LERRQRFRRAYEQRVDSGALKKYYERTKYRKRAQYDAKKAALLDESYTLGANAPIIQKSRLANGGERITKERVYLCKKHAINRANEYKRILHIKSIRLCFVRIVFVAFLFGYHLCSTA